MKGLMTLTYQIENVNWQKDFERWLNGMERDGLVYVDTIRKNDSELVVIFRVGA